MSSSLAHQVREAATYEVAKMILMSAGPDAAYRVKDGLSLAPFAITMLIRELNPIAYREYARRQFGGLVQGLQNLPSVGA